MMMTPAPAPMPDRRRALEAAIAAHNAFAGDCMQARGCDRHLMVLRLLARENGVAEAGGGEPALFADPAFGGSTAFALSTSNIGGSGWRAPSNEWWGGYAPSTADGYGCGYTISPQQVVVMLTWYAASGVADGPAFEAAFHAAMFDLAAVWQSAPAAKM